MARRHAGRAPAANPPHGGGAGGAGAARGDDRPHPVGVHPAARARHPATGRRGRAAHRAALATALLRLGVNLNQIARHMNAGRAAPSYLPALIEDIRRHVERLVDDEPGRDRQR
ncbi:hypothetical protein CNY89_15975 [Amaricoccus sp. HAR-UPW-R2A-40]|nr:hypothetical protein CNY89_15975 [Amaricoccus sp. HAR-UPW-R2A-40]